MRNMLNLWTSKLESQNKIARLKNLGMETHRKYTGKLEF